MKSLTIYPKERGEGFLVDFYETRENREDYEEKPHPYGFYHYPDNLKESTAFNRLKRAMIKDKEEKIEELKAEIKELKGMKYADI